MVLSSLLARLTEDKDSPVDSLVIGNAVLRPFRAATYLVSLVDLRELETQFCQNQHYLHSIHPVYQRRLEMPRSI